MRDLCFKRKLNNNREPIQAIRGLYHVMLEFTFTANVAKGAVVKPSNSYEMPVIRNIKTRLNATKSRLDMIPKADFDKYARMADPYADKTKYKRKFGSGHVTNAWLKIDEIMHWLKENELLPPIVNAFCNAEFPGAFILGLDHFFSNHDIPFDWHASSIIDTGPNAAHSNYLDDKYNLYKSQPEKWLMTATNNGDVTIADNLVDIAKRLPKVNLYTSDLGFQVTNFNQQEEEHLRAHFGAAVCGLMTLENGGIMILKQFTMFTDFNMSMFAYIASKFESARILKPDTSRRLNSETYLVFTGYQGIGEDEINRLLEILRNFTTEPLINKSKLKAKFVDEYTEMLNQLAIRQSTAICDLFHHWSASTQH